MLRRNGAAYNWSENMALSFLNILAEGQNFLAAPNARIQCIAQAVTHVIDRQNRQGNRKARPDHPFGIEGHEIGAVKQQPAPGRKILWKSQPQKRQSAFGDDRVGDAQSC